MKFILSLGLVLLFFVACNSGTSIEKVSEAKTNKDLIMGTWLSKDAKTNTEFICNQGFASRKLTITNGAAKGVDTTWHGNYSFKNNLTQLVVDYSGQVHDNYAIVTLNDTVMVLKEIVTNEIEIYRKVK
jgi:hypothetical protein